MLSYNSHGSLFHKDILNISVIKLFGCQMNKDINSTLKLHFEIKIFKKFSSRIQRKSSLYNNMKYNYVK